MPDQETDKTNVPRRNVPRDFIHFVTDKRAIGFWIAILGVAMGLAGFLADYLGFSIGYKVMIVASSLAAIGIIFNMLAWRE
jgi:hypothetical protein